jgi:hypothetical protein
MHNAFAVHMLNEEGKKKAERIAKAFDALQNELTEVIGPSSPSRELSICTTKLEEACFFAKKAMASQVHNQ